MFISRQSAVKRNARCVYAHIKLLSSQVAWESAKPYEDIPGPKNAYQLLRLWGPGGKYANMPLNELTTNLRKDYGTISRFPGILGQRPMVMTYLPEDIEKVLRNEGKFPNRRPLDSLHYFRKKHRPELYPAGAGLLTT